MSNEYDPKKLLEKFDKFKKDFKKQDKPKTIKDKENILNSFIDNINKEFKLCMGKIVANVEAFIKKIDTELNDIKLQLGIRKYVENQPSINDLRKSGKKF